MSQKSRRLRNENARLRAEVARLQAELSWLREVGPLQELLSRSLPRVVYAITRREAVQNAATAIRRDPLGFWEVVPPEPTSPQKGDQICRERPNGAELREFNGEKWVTIKRYFKKGGDDVHK
jgi:hypothetical protein